MAVGAFVQPIAIRFRDIDALNHVNHAVVLTYAETIRCDWFQATFGIPSMADLPFILASAHVDYKAPIAKSDEVEIAMWTSRIGTKSWTFKYSIRGRGGGDVLAEVETVQVAYDYAKGASVPVSPALRARLESISA